MLWIFIILDHTLRKKFNTIKYHLIISLVSKHFKIQPIELEKLNSSLPIRAFSRAKLKKRKKKKKSTHHRTGGGMFARHSILDTGKVIDTGWQWTEERVAFRGTGQWVTVWYHRLLPSMDHEYQPTHVTFMLHILKPLIPEIELFAPTSKSCFPTRQMYMYRRVNCLHAACTENEPPRCNLLL